MPRSVSRNGGRGRTETGHQHNPNNNGPVLTSASAPARQTFGRTADLPSGSDHATLQPAIRVVMMPRDANYLGTIFGGVILGSLDIAGVVEAARHTDRKLVTAAMREVKFIAPVFVGDLVSFYTQTVAVGRTSITVRVTVDAKRAAAPHETVRVTQAEVIYVAIDEAGKPRPVGT